MKNITDFKKDEVLLMEELLFTIYKGKQIPYVRIAESKDYTPKVDDYISYLKTYGYIREQPHSTLMGETYGDTTFYIKEKGEIICEKGGLLSIYENQFNEKSKSRRANIALTISIFAIILSILSFIFKH